MATAGVITRAYGAAGGGQGVITRAWGETTSSTAGVITRAYGSPLGAFNIDTTGNWNVEPGNLVPLHAITYDPINPDSLTWSQILAVGQVAWPMTGSGGDVVVEAPGTFNGEVGTFRVTGVKAGYPNSTEDVIVTVSAHNGLWRARSWGWDPVYLQGKVLLSVDGTTPVPTGTYSDTYSDAF